MGYIRCPRCDAEVESSSSVPQVHAAPTKTPTQRFKTPTQRFKTPTQRFSTQRFATGRVPQQSSSPAALMVAIIIILLVIASILLMTPTPSPKPTAVAPILLPPTPIQLPPAPEPKEPVVAREEPRPVMPEPEPIPEPMPPPPAPAPAPNIEPPKIVEPEKPVDPFTLPLQTLREKFQRSTATPIERSALALLFQPPSVPEDQSLLARYRSKTFASDVEAAQFLLEGMAKARKDSIRLPACRLVALGHLENLSQERRAPILAAFGPELELNGNVTAEGKAAEQLRSGLATYTVDAFDRAVDAAESVREPGLKTARGVFWILKVVKAAPADQPAAIVKANEYLSRDKRWAQFRALFAAARPCTRCKGTHELTCDFGCDAKGEFTKRCPTCNGTGLRPFTSSRQPCPEKRPGPHVWTEKCPRCAGTHKQPCRTCKGPWQPIAESSFVIRPCGLCSGKGALHDGFKTLCPECYGVGQSAVLK